MKVPQKPLYTFSLLWKDKRMLIKAVIEHNGIASDPERPAKVPVL